MTHLAITEIFESLQGEASHSGIPCTFIRLTGCSLRCRWCDTSYSFHNGSQKTIEDIISQVKTFGHNLIQVTGGEPLEQDNTIELIKQLLTDKYKVLLETSGANSLALVPRETHIVMDLKCPGSNMESRNDLENLKYLKKTDEIKFVIANQEDLDWSLEMLTGHKLSERFQVVYSPAWGLIKPETIAAWMIKYKINARLSLQIHKHIWGPRKKGV